MRRQSGGGGGWKRVVLGPWGAIAIGAIAVGLGLTFAQRLRSSMAAETAAPKPAPIDGDRAYGYLKTICALGRRPAGSPANEKQRKLVADHFKTKGAKVREQPFTILDPMDGKRVRVANLIGSWHSDRLERIVIAAHYDTRPYADKEPDPIERERKPFLGANDGASGVALLMEIANHLDKFETPWGIDLVLFDAEELVYGESPPLDQYFLGARYFSRSYAAERASRKIKYKYSAGILLDMVGYKDLVIDQELNSLRMARGLVQQIWSVAASLEEPCFRVQTGYEISDDHIPMNAVGIPTVDLIDLDYPHWHTTQDLPENCSGASLKSVGRVVTGWLSLPRPTTKGKKK
ncbi:MAG: M28 family peptidase [Isosphaeraceae bacterium]